MRAREAAADVAEQLRLEQRVGNAAAVDRDQWQRGAEALLVDETRRDLLADAALTGNQDLGIRTRGPANLEEDLTNSRADADECRPFA